MAENTSQHAVEKMKAPREVWVDALRGLAVVGMVWTHCANTFLTSALQQTPWFERLVFYHGLIAPTFFWVAGLMRGRAYGHQAPMRPTVLRLLSIMGLGYLLHTPWAELFRGDLGTNTWRTWLQMDVLQCLAISGFVLLMVERSGKRAVPLALGLMGVFITMRDLLAETQTGWTLIDAMLNRKSGSLFPIFPWVAFGLAGYVAGSLRVILTRSGPWWLWQWLLPGLVLAVTTESLPGAYTTLTFFLQRLGWVLMFGGVLAGSWPWIERLLGKFVLWPVLVAGRRSLTAYVAHLVLIYSVPMMGGHPLSQRFGLSCDLVQVVGLFLSVLALTILICWLLDWTKTKKNATRREAGGV